MRTYQELILEARTNGCPQIALLPEECVLVFEYLSATKATDEIRDQVLQCARMGECIINGKVVVLVTHLARPMKVGSLRTDWDWDMELVNGVWDVNRHVMCDRCGRRYRCGHHSQTICGEMFPE